MKRLGLVVVVLIVAVAFYRPAESRDTYGERISDLETRVAILEDGGAGGAPAGDHTIRGVVTISGWRNSQVTEDGTSCRGVGDDDEVFAGDERFAGLEGGEPVWVLVDDEVVASDELRRAR